MAQRRFIVRLERMDIEPMAISDEDRLKEYWLALFSES